MQKLVLHRMATYSLSKPVPGKDSARMVQHQTGTNGLEKDQINAALIKDKVLIIYDQYIIPEIP